MDRKRGEGVVFIKRFEKGEGQRVLFICCQLVVKGR